MIQSANSNFPIATILETSDFQDFFKVAMAKQDLCGGLFLFVF